MLENLRTVGFPARPTLTPSTNHSSQPRSTPGHLHRAQPRWFRCRIFGQHGATSNQIPKCAPEPPARLFRPAWPPPGELRGSTAGTILQPDHHDPRLPDHANHGTGREHAGIRRGRTSIGVAESNFGGAPRRRWPVRAPRRPAVQSPGPPWASRQSVPAAGRDAHPGQCTLLRGKRTSLGLQAWPRPSGTPTATRVAKLGSCWVTASRPTP